MSKIHVHHVGGRWGDDAFSAPAVFDTDLVRVLYEADADAVQTIEEALLDRSSECHVVNACLSDSDGEATLNLTLNPGITSILDPGDALRQRYRNFRGVDFGWEEGARVVARRTLPTTTLDAALKRHRMAAPDFLSLDAQGSEYPILSGAAESLETICGMIVEVEFVEMYRGQKRFQDILDLLDSRGFSFVRFERMGELGGPRKPIGQRGSGCQMWADALFLRRPDTPSSESQLEKLAFIATAYGHLEFAMSCLERLGQDWRDGPRDHDRLYVNFLLDLFDARDAFQSLTPPSLAEALPVARANEFSAAPSTAWYKVFDLRRYNDERYFAALRSLQSERSTSIETVLQRYGFDLLFLRVKEMRRSQAGALEDTLRKAIDAGLT